MKRCKIWLALLLSLAIGCGNTQNADGEKQAENLTPTEALEQKEIQEQEENTAQTEEKTSEIVIVNSSTGQSPTPNPEETDELMLVYDKFAGYVEDMTIGDDGTLYAVCLWEESKQNPEDCPIWVTKPKQRIYAFDGNGEILWCLETFFPTAAESLMSSKQEAILEWSNDFLYMVLPGVHKMPVLYRLNPETWEGKDLYCFENFSEITQLIFMGDRLYVYGILANPKEKQLVQNLEYLEKYPSNYKGETIGCLDMENLDAGITILPIDVPKEMIKLTEDTLGIYQTGEDAEYFWKYTPVQETWEKTDIAVSYHQSTVEERPEKSPWCRNFTAYADGCIYAKEEADICYETEDGTERFLLKADAMPHNMQSDGTFLYYYTHAGNTKKIQRVEISKLFENQTE